MFLILFFSFQPKAASFDWQVETSQHFIIYHQSADRAYLNQLTSKAENYYRSITNNLGFQRFDFWLWDDRCEIFLYPGRAEYLEETGSIAWSRAHVDVVKKQITTFIGQENFFDVILPHELAHIIFREFVGFDKRLPLWLDEGVAMLAEAESPQRLRFAQNLVSAGKHIPLDKLSDIRAYTSIDPNVFYSQAASIVNFLLNRYGRRTFVDFCRQLRDRDNWLEALRRTYGFNSLEELEAGWLDSLE